MKKAIAWMLTLIMILSMMPMAMAAVTDPKANEVGISPIVKDGEKVVLTLGLIQNANVTDYDDNHYTKLLEELTGIDLEFMLFSGDDATTKLDLMATSGHKMPDILLFGMGDNIRRANYGANGIIIPVEEYYERLGAPLYARAEKIGLDLDKALKAVTSPDGHNYAASIFVEDCLPNYTSLRSWINTTWLEKLGLEMPTTSEELYNVLVAFRDQDPNGNGIADEIPFIGCPGAWNGNPINYLQNMFIYYNQDGTGFLPLNETGGKLDVAYDKDAYREALKYVNRLVSEGLLSPLAFTQDYAQHNAFLLQEPCIVGVVTDGAPNSLFNGNHPNDQYTALEACAGPDGVQYQSYLKTNPYATGAITSQCENPEIAFLFLEYLYYYCMGIDDTSRPVYETARFGEQGVDWDYAEEGTPSMFSELGLDANVVVHNITWGLQTNKHWNNVSDKQMLIYAPDVLEAYDGNEQNPERQYALSYMKNSKYFPNPDDIPGALSYTQEEIDQWNDLRVALKSYVSEAAVLFAMGEMDPNSDADWQNYLDELNNLQYKDILAVDQGAYDRIYGE